MSHWIGPLKGGRILSFKDCDAFSIRWVHSCWSQVPVSSERGKAVGPFRGYVSVLRFLRLIQVSGFCLSLFQHLSLSMALRFNSAVGRWLMGKHFGNMLLVGIALNSGFSSNNHNCLEGLVDCDYSFISRISAPVKVSVRRCITFSACSCRIAGKFLLMEQLFSQDRYSPKQVQVAIKSSKCT